MEPTHRSAGSFRALGVAMYGARCSGGLPRKATRWIGVGFWACSFSRRSPFYSVWAGEIPPVPTPVTRARREQRREFFRLAAVQIKKLRGALLARVARQGIAGVVLELLQ
jgi:hypothetical protein